MDVKTALLKRKSTRAFLDKEVSIDVINEIIDQSKTAPSGVNTQPWQVAVLTGKSKDNLCNRVIRSPVRDKGTTSAQAHYRQL